MKLEDYGVFIKLVEEEYVEDTLNGNLHFSSLKSFTELEEKQAGGIADKNEGVMNISIPMANAFIRLRSGNRENKIMPLHDIKARINFSITEEQKKSTGICCFMYLPLSKFDCKREENIIRASFGKKLREHILNFLNSTEDEKEKKCEIMMVDSVDLIELLANNKLAYGSVYYYDNYNFDKTIDFINAKNFSPVFCTSSIFSNQSEFRVVTKLPDGKESVNLSIGHLNSGVILDRDRLEDYEIVFGSVVDNRN